MGMWNYLPIEELIDTKTARFSAGLARKKWYELLDEIRALPETPPATDEELNDGR